MIRLLQNIILLIAIGTVTAHSIFPHIHHDEAQIITGDHRNHAEQLVALGQHEKDSDEQHSIFSFVQLDENFFPANAQNKKVTPQHTFLFARLIAQQQAGFPVVVTPEKGHTKAYPVFDSHHTPPSHRGPPIV